MTKKFSFSQQLVFQKTPEDGSGRATAEKPNVFRVCSAGNTATRFTGASELRKHGSNPGWRWDHHGYRGGWDHVESNIKTHTSNLEVFKGKSRPDLSSANETFIISEEKLLELIFLRFPHANTSSFISCKLICLHLEGFPLLPIEKTDQPCLNYPLTPNHSISP